MSKKDKFIEMIEALMDGRDLEDEFPEAMEYWNVFKGAEDKPKPLFTDNGKLVMKFLQENVTNMPMAKAKNIAEGLLISSRGVSGAMRKLVTDGFVDKIGENPAIYTLTEKGKNINIED